MPMKAIPALLLSVILITCSTPKEKIPPLDTMKNPSGKAIIYQLMPRLFGNKTTVNRPFGTIEENGVGKFNDISGSALEAIRELGITHIWYTGVIEHAVLTDYTQFGIPLDDADVVKGRAGSPYAIKDYYDVDPDLAVDVPNRMKEFEQLVERTHANGLKVLIDFVPNHVARAYRSDAKPEGVKDLGETDNTTMAFSPDNNFYYLPGQTFKVPYNYKPLGYSRFPTKDGKFQETPAKATGNDQFTGSPEVTDWFETVKLNYGVDIPNGRKKYFDPIPDTWLKMRDILVFWANKGTDGFRCDMAEMVPVEFWNWVIPQVKAINQELIFIGEIYNPSAYKNYIDAGKFDYLYDKVLLYDTLRFLLRGEKSTLDIDRIQQQLSGIQSRMLHFMENHDEQRMASKFLAGDMWKGLPAMVISATIDRGPVMIYFGQEVGEPAVGAEGFQGDDGRTTIFDYWGIPEHQKWMNGGAFDGGGLNMEQKQLQIFYSDLLNLAGKNPAITDGDYVDLTATNIAAGNFDDEIHAFLRTSGDERLLILCGFNRVEKNVRVKLPEEVVRRIGMDPSASYIARDMLWKEAELGFDANWSFELKMKPYSSFIFKIK